MDEARWSDIERERESLADLLDSLTPKQWEVPSLCARWRVRDVAAHVAMTPIPEPSTPTLLRELARARGHLWNAAAEIAIAYAQRPTSAIVEELRRQADSRRFPAFSNPENMLLDTLIHGQDVALPLGIQRPMPTEAALAGFRRTWSMGWPFHAQRRMRGIRLVATDAPLAVGDVDGARIEGLLADLLLLISGRTSTALARLEGEGKALLCA